MKVQERKRQDDKWSKAPETVGDDGIQSIGLKKISSFFF